VQNQSNVPAGTLSSRWSLVVWPFAARVLGLGSGSWLPQLRMVEGDNVPAGTLGQRL